MSEETEATEVELTGGGTTRVVRVADTVRRPARPWSATVGWMLTHVRDAGMRSVPRWHGTDETGREILDYLPGDVGNYPLSENVRSQEALTSAARLLCEFHDATVPLLHTDGLAWQLPPMEPAEVVCHGDFAPYNCVFDGTRAVGIIDFDYARPGPRRWDLAYALYRFAPFTDLANGDGFGDLEQQAHRAGLFLSAYGCSPRQRLDALHTVVPRLRSLVELMLGSADAGDEAFQRAVDSGHADLYLRDIRYFETRLDTVVDLVGAG